MVKTETLPKYISEGKTAYKVHITTPDKKVTHRSVGFIRMGKKKALKKAVKLRNDLLKEVWGVHWQSVLNCENFLLKLPRTLEPIFCTDKTGREYYRAMFTDANGNRHCRKRSVEKHGKLGAYIELKKIILEAHASSMNLITKTERIVTIGLK